MKKFNFFDPKPFIGLISLLTMLIVPTVTNAQKAESVEAHTAVEIAEQAVAYVAALFPAPNLGKQTYEAVPLDERIKIKPCDQTIQYSIPGNAKLSKQTTVLARCNGTSSWNLYVQVKIYQQIPVVVARKTMAPGTVIDPSHLATRLVEINQLRGRTLQDPTPLYGAKIDRLIAAGQPVTMRQVCLVCKGDQVTVIAKLKGLSVKTSGISQQNGSLGDNIAILNQSSNKQIKARVVAVNRVEINI